MLICVLACFSFVARCVVSCSRRSKRSSTLAQETGSSISLGPIRGGVAVSFESHLVVERNSFRFVPADRNSGPESNEETE